MMNNLMKTVGAPIPHNGPPLYNNGGPHPGLGGPNDGLHMPRKRYYGGHNRRLQHNPLREHTLRSANLPLEDAAKLEMTRSSTTEHNKTPVNIIQEILSRRNIIPVYELLPVEGTLNEPLYQYKLMLESEKKTYVGIGGGRSKKEAKKNTAKSMLNQLLGVQDDTPVMKTKTAESQNLVPNGTSKTPKPTVGPQPVNPVSLLQETCFARRWPPPYYEIDNPNGMPHERQYTTTVFVDKYCESATAKTKKLSKQEAAKKMLQVLKSVPANPVDFKKLHQETQQQNISNQKGFDPVQYLHEISQEQRFEITFVEIEDKSLSGQFQALVQLATYPVAVCHGQGQTQQEAKTVAAHNAIEYLRLMTKSTK